MKSDLRQEQERLDRIMETVTEQIAKLEDETSRQRQEVVEIRRNFWEDVTLNLDNFDDFLETIISLRQQAEVLSLNQSSHRLSSRRLSAMRRLKETPFFGRIDFTEEGTKEAERIYIGVSSLTDADGEHFLIYDWRTPVASVYYDYPPGPAEYDTPGGTIRGTLEEKRQYVIRNGVIESMFDTSLTIGDEILRLVLGQGANSHMRSIVSTIQQEQNRIIRHDRGRLLIVHGAAGSGKTSAALQRIAYLLYKYRGKLTADQILLLSPNAMFNSYVSTVLPELGEENMQQATFQEYLNHRLKGRLQVEDAYGQLEYVLTARPDDPDRTARLAAIRFKASVRFFEALQAYRKSLDTAGMVFRSIRFRGAKVVTSQEMTDRFYGSHTSLKFANRLEKLAEWLSVRLDEAAEAALSEPWVQEEIELMSNEDYQRARVRLRKTLGAEDPVSAGDVWERETEALGRMIVRQKLQPLRQRIRNLQFIDFAGLYKQMFAVPERIAPWLEDVLPEDWADICRLSVKMLEEGRLFYEDATPYLFLKELVLGFQTNLSIKHVLVDEAQDYSPFQFEFLKRLFPAARMTVLGDFNQAIFAHAGETDDFRMLTGLYGPDETETVTLSRSYRSTRPLVEFTRSLLPGGHRIVPFDRDGEQPVLTQVPDHETLHRTIAAQAAELLRDRKDGTVAVICQSAAESAAAYEALRGLLDIKLVTAGSLEYEKGLVVLPAYLAKGIEFDAVLLYNASAQVYGDESLRRLFYTACTRAMHDLRMYSLGEPSPFLRGDKLFTFRNSGV